MTEPRTAAGRDLFQWMTHGPGGYNDANARYWLPRILAIEAESAEPARLDGATLSEAMHRAGIRVGERRVGEVIAHYARLAALTTQETADTE